MHKTSRLAVVVCSFVAIASLSPSAALAQCDNWVEPAFYDFVVHNYNQPFGDQWDEVWIDVLNPSAFATITVITAVHETVWNGAGCAGQDCPNFEIFADKMTPQCSDGCVSMIPPNSHETIGIFNNGSTNNQQVQLRVVGADLGARPLLTANLVRLDSSGRVVEREVVIVRRRACN